MSKNVDRFLDSDEQAAQEAQRAELQKRRQERELSDIKWLMGHVEGRRLMARLLYDVCKINSSTFRPNSEMPFLEGQRNVGLIFYADVQEMALEDFNKMLLEQKELREHERAS